MSRPDVSVVIPTYNRREMVQRAIESCFAGNEDIKIEVIVVDDGSTDGTRDYLKSIDDSRVHPIFQEHQGAQVARNAGQDDAQGHAIKHLDDDDYLCPDGLQRQYELLWDAGVDATYGDVYVIDDRNNDGRRSIRHFGKTDTLFSGLTSETIDRVQWAYLFRREIVEPVRWDESLDFLQDFAFMHEVASQHVTLKKVIGKPIAVHHAHAGVRVTDARNQADRGARYNFKCECVLEATQALVNSAATEAQAYQYCIQGARGIWKEIHKIAPFDFELFQKWYTEIQFLAPQFVPQRPNKLLAISDRLMSPKTTERMINPVRKWKASLR